MSDLTDEQRDELTAALTRAHSEGNPPVIAVGSYRIATPEIRDNVARDAVAHLAPVVARMITKARAEGLRCTRARC